MKSKSVYLRSTPNVGFGGRGGSSGANGGNGKTNFNQQIGQLSSDIKSLLQSQRLPFNNGGILEKDKIAVEDLGLKKGIPSTKGNFEIETSIDISKIDIGRENLSRARLLNLEKTLSGGFKRQPGEAAVHVARSLTNPDRYVVTGNGNHRLAYLILTGYKGQLPVTLRTTRPKKKKAVK